MIDYAYPCMMAEAALKNLHFTALDKDYDTAIEHCLIALTETRMTLNALKHMKEQQDALRKQTETV